MNQNRFLYIQLQTLPQSMHHKMVRKFDFVCKEINKDELPTNIPIEIKESSWYHRYWTFDTFLWKFDFTINNDPSEICQVVYKSTEFGVSHNDIEDLSQNWIPTKLWQVQLEKKKKEKSNLHVSAHVKDETDGFLKFVSCKCAGHGMACWPIEFWSICTSNSFNIHLQSTEFFKGSKRCTKKFTAQKVTEKGTT